MGLNEGFGYSAYSYTCLSHSQKPINNLIKKCMMYQIMVQRKNHKKNLPIIFRDFISSLVYLFLGFLLTNNCFFSFLYDYIFIL